jgi:hypothetical protein
MDTVEKSAHLKGSWKPVVLAVGIALASASAAAANSDCVQIGSAGGCGDMQAGELAYQIGSGYTTDEDRVIPADPLNHSLAVNRDLTAGKFNRGYYQEPDEVAVLVSGHDGTAYQFNRGYYQDPDAVILVVNSAAEQNEG